MQNIQPEFFTLLHKQAYLNQVSACARPSFKSEYDQIEINQPEGQTKNNKVSPGTIVGAAVAIAGALAVIYALVKGKPSGAKNTTAKNLADKAETAGEKVERNINANSSSTKGAKEGAKQVVANATNTATTLRKKAKEVVTGITSGITTLKKTAIDAFSDFPTPVDNATVATFKGSVQLAIIKNQSGVFRTILKGAKQKPVIAAKTSRTKPQQDVFKLIKDFIIDENFGKTNSKIIKAIQTGTEAQREEAYYSYYKKLHQQNVEILDKVLLGRTRRGLSHEELNAIERL